MQPTSFTCSRCGAPLMPGTIQCANCGQTFAAPVPAGPAPGFMPPPPASKNPAGVIIGLVVALFGGVFVLAILAAILFPVFAQARDKAREITSASNLKILGLATMMYAQDYDQRLPPMDSFDHYKAAINSYVPNQKDNSDPFVETGFNVPYQINSAMSRKSLGDLPNARTTVLLEESVPHSRHMINVLYADGHVELVPQGNEQSPPSSSQ
jgi:prepilin-type processing-associated H-X9-DG protein